MTHDNPNLLLFLLEKLSATFVRIFCQWYTDSVPQNTGLNLSNDYIFIRNVYKNVVDLFNFTELVQVLKMKYVLLGKLSQNNHSLGTAVTPEWV